jgi:hypothetical protein
MIMNKFNELYESMMNEGEDKLYKTFTMWFLNVNKKLNKEDIVYHGFNKYLDSKGFDISDIKLSDSHPKYRNPNMTFTSKGYTEKEWKRLFKAMVAFMHKKQIYRKEVMKYGDVK